MFQFGQVRPALVAATLGVTGCATHETLPPGGFDLKSPLLAIEPSDRAVAELTHTAVSYEDPTPEVAVGDLKDMTLKSCLVRAVHHNRNLRQRTYTAQRAGLEQPIARREIDAPLLDAAYSGLEGDDSGDGRAGVTGRWAGFEIEPFVRFEFDEDQEFRSREDDFSSSYGVAVARNIFRIRHEDVRQHLPLTRATRDFHVAINERLLELRQLHLQVVEVFYEIQRLWKRISVRANRVEDAEKFLADVTAKVQAGISAPFEETNARINLNQAKSDLVREQTTHLNTIDRLLDLMGVDLASSATFVEDDLSDIQQGANDLEAEIELTLHHHETVRNQLLVMEVQRQEYWIDSEQVRPDLDAVLTAAEGFDGNDDDDEVRLDLILQVPLDNFGAERARRTQDRLRLLELAIELDGIRSDLERQLRQHHRTIDQLDTSVELAQYRVHDEHRKLDAFRESYERGAVADILELTRAKQTVDQAEVDLLDAQINRVVEKARYWAIVPPAPDSAGRPNAPDAP